MLDRGASAMGMTGAVAGAVSVAGAVAVAVSVAGAVSVAVAVSVSVAVDVSVGVAVAGSAAGSGVRSPAEQLRRTDNPIATACLRMAGTVPTTYEGGALPLSAPHGPTLTSRFLS